MFVWAVSLDANTIAKTLEGAAYNLQNYYKPNFSGAIPTVGATDETGMHWYESGIIWGAMQDYIKISQDNRFVNLVGGALANASFGKEVSFLSSNQLVGKIMGIQNDDLMWWSMGPVSAAETYGSKSVMPNGNSFLQLAINTYDQVWAQWSSATCNGGIYWGRDREAEKANEANYKAFITNGLFINVGARLFLLTGNQKYVDQIKQVYDWLKVVRMVDDQGNVFDGATAPTCEPMSTSSSSYLSGTMAGALGLLYQVTKDPTYLSDAAKVVDTFSRVFTRNNVITDLCEPNCQLWNVQPKGTAIRGLYTLWNSTTDANIRSKIQTMIDASLQAMTCDANNNCNAVWTEPFKTNVHTQLLAVELLNAAALIHDAPKSQNRLVITGQNSGWIQSPLIWLTLMALNLHF